MQPKVGDVLWIDGRASVQFAGDRALILRVTVVDDRPTYHGWVWLHGYVLNRFGEAVEQREVFVQVSGLRKVEMRRPYVRPAGPGPRGTGVEKPENGTDRHAQGRSRVRHQGAARQGDPAGSR
jgi:hypothetical protein